MSVESYVFSGCVIEEEVQLSLAELSQACCVNGEWLMALVDEGILEPLPGQPQWRFSGESVHRARTVQRLQQDLGVNMAGAALALELLKEINTLRQRLAMLEPDEAR
ncbi:MAG TPA: MerR family transcriptional regulator [Candidatus Tenderia sp.]|nr:MerR family transcriptional regulator [Candidatus Tenderia sp.]